MLSKKTVCLSLLTILVLISFFDVASADRITEKEQEFWDTFVRMIDAAEDQKRIDRFVRRNKTPAMGIFNEFLVQLQEGKISEVNRTHMPQLAQVLSEITKTEEYNFSYAYTVSLDGEQKTRWLAAYNLYGKATVAYEEGKAADNPYVLDDASLVFQKAFDGFEELGDIKLAAEVAMRFGWCHEALKDGYLASVWFSKAIEKMKELPFTHIDENEIQGRLDYYLRKGFDPTKPRDEGGTPTGDSTEGGQTEDAGDAEGSADGFKHPVFEVVGKEETWEFKYQVMRSPYEFDTPSLSTAFNPYLWSNAFFDGFKHDTVQFHPYYLDQYQLFNFYGKQVNWVYDEEIYFDIDGDEKTRVEVKATTRPSKLILKGTEKGPDKKNYLYHLFVTTTGSEEVMFGLTLNNAVTDTRRKSLRLRPACFTKGRVMKDDIVLIDDNTSGVYGDVYPSEGDTITPGNYPYDRTDAVVVGKEKKARPFSQYLWITDRFYSFQVDAYGRKVTTAEVSVETGTVKLDWSGDKKPSYLVLHLLNDDTPLFFIDVAGQKDPVVVPVGEYEICWGKIEEPKKGSSQSVAIYNGKSDYLKVFAGQETVLELGAPYTFAFNTETSGNTFRVIGSSINVFGKRGEVYGKFFEQLPQPLVSIRNKESGKVIKKAQKMKPPSQEAANENRMVIWSPMDYVYESKSGSALEAKLEAKKLKMLGGPATSEWR